VIFWTPWGIPIGLSDLIDIVATAILAYYVLLLIRGTRAVQIVLGLLVVLIMLAVSNLLHLLVLATILQYVLLGTAVTLPIVFQPELRRALEQLGRGGILRRRETAVDPSSPEATLGVLARAAVILSRSRVGALIAVEQSTGLREFVESGTRMDAQLSLELLLTMFTPNSPLHDGAVIVRGATIEAAACFLPLSENVRTDFHLGTRHRAALGLTEQTDAVVVVVSEQTGQISVAHSGRISREIDDEDRLRNVLYACCRAQRTRTPRKPRRGVPVPPVDLAETRSNA
jgi:diadenylate cyclase